MQSTRTVLVVANAHDAVAGGFARRYASQGTRLLLPGDLSQSGWRYELGDHAGLSHAVVSGRGCREDQLAGIIVRLVSVTPSDLPHIVPADRVYVAQEMQAFLAAWLGAMSCPVLNRPTPTCLAGEWWSPQTWIHKASLLGIPVARSEWSVVRGLRTNPARPAAEKGSAASITVVGSQIIGDVSPRIAHYARRLAQAAELELVTLRFSSSKGDAQFIDAGLRPNLADPRVATAVMRHVRGRRGPPIRSGVASA